MAWPGPRSGARAAASRVAGGRRQPGSSAANQSISARRAWCATSAGKGRCRQEAAWSARAMSGLSMLSLLRVAAQHLRVDDHIGIEPTLEGGDHALRAGE